MKFWYCVVYTKTIIHLNVAESGVKTIHLRFGEQLIIILQSTKERIVLSCLLAFMIDLTIP